MGIEYDQNVGALPVAVIAIRAVSNALDDIRPLIPAVLSALEELRPGTLVRVG